MWDTVFTYLERLLLCLSPIICAWMAWKSSVSQKKTKEFMELQAKYNQKIEDDKRKEIVSHQDSINDLNAKIEKLSKQVTDLANQSGNQKVVDKLNDILKISRMQFDYSTSMSQVICAIGDCIENSNVGDISAMKKELDRHQKFERTMTSELLKLVE